ncbi:DUF2142 domain-containing protein [Schumannella luteola]
MHSPSTTRRWPRWLPFALVPVLALITLLSWGMASSVGSSPDDDFHLPSIWCGHGITESCEVGDADDQRTVSRDLFVDAVCNAFNSEASAICQGEDFGHNPDDASSTKRVNADGLYPPVYYFVMSFLVNDDIEASVLLVRSVNAVIFVGLVSLLYWLLPLHRRQTLVWAILVTVVPLGLWVIPSNNPSTWAITAAATLWLALLGVFESTGRRRIGLGAISAVSVVMAAGARADAALYSGLTVLVVLLLVAQKKRELLWPAVFALGLGAVAGALFLTAHQSEAVATGLGGGFPEYSPVTLALANLINIPALFAGVYGNGFGLGWLDTELPAVATYGGLIALIAAIIIGVATRVPRKLLAAAVVAFVLVAMPVYLLVQSQSIVGANFQPRYILPLLIVFAGLILLQTPERPLVVTRLQVGIVVVLLAAANAIALHTVMRRYITGTDVASVNLDSGVEWWWDIAISPMTVWIAGSLAFTGVLVLLASRALNTPLPGRTGGALVVERYTGVSS